MRASLSPIAIACLRVVTFRPDPLFSVPFFFRRIADSTVLDAPLPYFGIATPGLTFARSAPKGSIAMAKCDLCGNDYDKSFEVVFGGSRHTFDSFECAIHKLAPQCAHCGCRIIGHGIEADGTMYCCANCARHSGVRGVADRV